MSFCFCDLYLKKFFFELSKVVRLAGVSCDAGQSTVDALQPVTGQSQKRSEFAGEPRQEVRAADVREKSDPGFRHRKNRSLGGDPELAVHGEADAASHGDTVNHGHVRNPESANLKS